MSILCVAVAQVSLYFYAAIPSDYLDHPILLCLFDTITAHFLGARRLRHAPVNISDFLYFTSSQLLKIETAF